MLIAHIECGVPQEMYSEVTTASVSLALALALSASIVNNMMIFNFSLDDKH